MLWVFFPAAHLSLAPRIPESLLDMAVFPPFPVRTISGLRWVLAFNAKVLWDGTTHLCLHAKVPACGERCQALKMIELKCVRCQRRMFIL